MADEQVIEHLTRVKGIGRWTAEMFLIFVLNRQDILPVDDLGLVESNRRPTTPSPNARSRVKQLPWRSRGGPIARSRHGTCGGAVHLCRSDFRPFTRKIQDSPRSRRGRGDLWRSRRLRGEFCGFSHSLPPPEPIITRYC